MKNFWNIYTISINKIIKKPLFYVALCIPIIISFFVMLIIPAMSITSISSYYESSTWTQMVFAGILSAIVIPTTIFGELNAINNEKIYFLSKSITRSTFLFAKCFVTFSLGLIICLFCSLFLIIIALVEYYVKHETIFNHSHGNNAYSIFISFIVVTFFASFCSTIWKYIFKDGYSVILFSALILIYVIVFPLLVELDRSDFDDNSRLLWVTLPIGIYSFLTIIFGSIGYYIFSKSEIES